MTDESVVIHDADADTFRDHVGAITSFPGAGGGAVDSVFGRSGTVVAMAGDYTAAEVTNVPAGGIAAVTVQAALNELDTEKLASGASAGGALDGTFPNPGLAAGVAGAGLSESSDVLAVNVDGSTIEISSDSLRVKADGITANEIASGAVGASELAATTVAAGSYGDATNVPQITVDADGRITAATDVPITGGGGGFAVAVETPSGTVNGSNVTFTLSAAPDPPEDLLLWKSGLLQKQGVDYTISTDTITFTTAPATGSVLVAALPVEVGTSPYLPTADEKDALDAANAPDGGNPFATMADVGGGSGIPVDGWQTLSGLSYSSADAPTFVIATSSDLSGQIGIGDRIKLTQTTVKYFVVTAIGASTITVYGGTDYTLANTTISSPSFSNIKAPLGFPLDPAKWTVTVTDTNNCNKNSPTSGTWYGGSGLSATGPSIDIPIGCWHVLWGAGLQVVRAAAAATSVWGTLSTANNTESDTSMTAGVNMSSNANEVTFLSRDRFLTLAAKTTHYLNIKTTDSSMTSIATRGDFNQPTILRAVCAYL